METLVEWISSELGSVTQSLGQFVLLTFFIKFLSSIALTDIERCHGCRLGTIASLLLMILTFLQIHPSSTHKLIDSYKTGFCDARIHYYHSCVDWQTLKTDKFWKFWDSPHRVSVLLSLSFWYCFDIKSLSLHLWRMHWTPRFSHQLPCKHRLFHCVLRWLTESVNGLRKQTAI